MNISKSKNDNLINKLYKKQLQIEASNKKILDLLKQLENAEKDNDAYKNNIIELTTKVGIFVNQEEEKYNTLKNKLNSQNEELKKKTAKLLAQNQEYEKGLFPTSNKSDKKTILIVGASIELKNKTSEKLESTYDITFVDSISEAIELKQTISFDLFIANLELVDLEIDSLLK